MDNDFVEKIVQEVKSQGVFDEFRKDSLADVDTKPAYQNLRSRVENAVKSFLSKQKWTPETNKIQLREKLRKHIIDLGFLDVGVEHIVDQVVNPKVATLFQPKIDAIAYKYLGISPPEPIRVPPPRPPPMIPPPPLPPLNHLNAAYLKVETTASLLPTDLEQISPDSDRATVKSDMREEIKDDDLPPGVDANERLYDDDISPPFEPLGKCLSPVNTSEVENMPKAKNIVELIDDVQVNTIQTIEFVKEDASMEAAMSQESQLSQVSSASILTPPSSFSANDAIEQCKNNLLTSNDAVNISEEAQMPKFNENSSETNGIGQNGSELHFDIKKDAITFEGTERRNSLSAEGISIEDAIMTAVRKNLDEQNCVTPEPSVKIDDLPIANAQEVSFGSCVEESQSTVIPKTLDESQSTVIPKTLDETLLKLNENGTKEKLNGEAAAVVSYKMQSETERADNSKDELLKPSTPSSTTSSSRHKKHSKNKRYHPDDKHRHKFKDHESSRDKHGHRKHSSSSNSKHTISSSSKHISSHKSSKHDKNSAPQGSSTSSRSSTAHDANNSKRSDRRETDKKYKSSSVKSEHRSHNSSSSSKKVDRHKISINDDHNEVKTKIHRRRSNDSNDDDGKNQCSNGKQATIQLLVAGGNSPKDNKSNTSSVDVVNQDKNRDNGCKKYENEFNLSKVIILNDILQNPSTDYIELNSYGGSKVFKNVVEKHSEQIEQSSDEIANTTNAESLERHSEQQQIEQHNDEVANITNSGNQEELLYFAEDDSIFTNRLRLIQNLIAGCQLIINDFIAEKSLTRVTRQGRNKRGLTTDTLSAEYKSVNGEVQMGCVQLYSEDETNEFIQTKRLKRDVSKISPTISDASVNSKENLALDKDESDDTGNHLSNKLPSNASSLSKLNQQQRYTNEDLYKPRPVLSQRSRRRHLNCIP